MRFDCVVGQSVELRDKVADIRRRFSRVLGRHVDFCPVARGQYHRLSNPALELRHRLGGLYLGERDGFPHLQRSGLVVDSDEKDSQ